jgi:hypothetical protein
VHENSRRWPQAVRWMMRLSRDSGLRPTVKIDRGEGTVAVDALTCTGEFRDFLQLQAKVVAPDPDSSGQTLDLKQTAPRAATKPSSPPAR